MYKKKPIPVRPRETRYDEVIAYCREQGYNVGEILKLFTIARVNGPGGKPIRFNTVWAWASEASTSSTTEFRHESDIVNELRRLAKA